MGAVAEVERAQWKNNKGPTKRHLRARLGLIGMHEDAFSEGELDEERSKFRRENELRAELLEQAREIDRLKKQVQDLQSGAPSGTYEPRLSAAGSTCNMEKQLDKAKALANRLKNGFDKTVVELTSSKTSISTVDKAFKNLQKMQLSSSFQSVRAVSPGPKKSPDANA